jgi:hypothetical protein
MSDASARTWRSIVWGVAISAGAIGLSVAGSVAIFIFQHHDSAVVSREAADAEFAQRRQAFAGQAPLVEIGDGANPVVHRAAAAPEHASDPSRLVLHVVVFDALSGKIVRISLPWHAVRLMHPNGFTYLGELTFLEDTEFDGDRILVSLHDLEQRGRGLVVDHRHSGGGQFLVWVQ